MPINSPDFSLALIVILAKQITRRTAAVVLLLKAIDLVGNAQIIIIRQRERQRDRRSVVISLLLAACIHW